MCTVQDFTLSPTEGLTTLGVCQEDVLKLLVSILSCILCSQSTRSNQAHKIMIRS